MASPQEVFKKLRPPVGMIRDQFKGHFGSKKAHAACSCVENYLPTRTECVSAAPTGLGSQVTRKGRPRHEVGHATTVHKSKRGGGGITE